MRIATWNCQKAFDKKVDALLSLTPDVAVVPECSEKSVAAFRERGWGTLWFGSNPQQGIGIICREEWPMRAMPQPQQKWIVPVEVASPNPFTLIGVWACAVGASRESRYIAQVYQALTTHLEWFNGNPLVLAGDFNSNKIWDGKRKVGTHSDVVKFLDEHGLVSAYHENLNESQGAETCPTFHLFRHIERPYHIDYVFIPREWLSRLRSVTVGKYEQWFRLSDHCPVVVDVS